MPAQTSIPWRTLTAALFAAALIIGAYVIARDTGSPAQVEASAESDLLEKLAARDSDNDGLRDWEEALYATNPQVADTRKLGMTDGEAVSKGLIVPISPAALTTSSSTSSTIDPSIPVPAEGTITRALAESFVTKYFDAVDRSASGNLTQAELRKLSDSILAELSDSIIPAPDFRTRDSIKVTGSGPDALRTYAVTAEAVFRAHRTTATDVDISYLKRALEDGDQGVYPQLLSIAKGYQDTAAGLAVIPVPSEMVEGHLALINSMARLSKIVADFTRADSDPFATLLALRQYPEAMKLLGTGFIYTHKTYVTAGVTFGSGEPGGAFVNLIEGVAARQAAEKERP